MLLTKRLTYVHEPKTGGSFVTHALSLLHGGLIDVPPSRLQRQALAVGLPTLSLALDRLHSDSGHGADCEGKYGRLYRWNDHGTCSQIPLGRSRHLLATARNPLETYVSLFLFGWWKRDRYLPLYERVVPGFRRKYPNFPDLSFREYLALLHAECTLHESRDLSDEHAPGYLTERFVRFYFRLPRTRRAPAGDVIPVMKKLDRLRDYESHMYPARFILTPRLNDELPEILAAAGYDPADLQFIHDLGHVVPLGGDRVGVVDQPASQEWRSFYTPELETLVRSKDRLLFRLFPAFEND